MALLTLSDDLTIQHVECGKQGRSAITFVVVGHRFCAALFEGKSRLGPVQGLYLTFFISGLLCVVNSTRRATSTWSCFIIINLKFHQECNTTLALLVSGLYDPLIYKIP
mgnify:CR=1 FL=1